MSEFVSHSQAGQDLFVYEQSGRKTNGTFIDLGCNDPIVHSNTYALEELGWRGLLVDIIPCAGGRKSQFIIHDVSNNVRPVIDYWEAQKGFVDYISIDVDNATAVAFLGLPWTEFKAGVVTIEHDRYSRGDAWRDMFRGKLLPLGYRLERADVVAPGYGEYEDWFVLNGYP